MNIETALNYVTLHSQSMIQWLFFIILALVGVLIAQALFGTKSKTSAATSPGASSAHAEAAPTSSHSASTHHAAAADAPAHSTASAPAAGGDADERIRALRADLLAREAEIEKLRAAVAAPPAGQPTSGADESALAARLKQLEAKLSEYEILEDDIADLSLYKDENTRLKNELEVLKSRPAAAAASIETPAAAPEPAPTNLDELNDLEAAADDDAPLETFDAPGASAPARTAEAAAEAAAALSAFDEPAPVPAATIPAEGADDLFAEFASALEDNVAAGIESKTAVGES